MLVPRGKPIHENLSTSYVNVAALLADLQVNEFTGYVSIGFWNYEGFIFLSRGQILNAYEQTDAGVKREREALDSILSRAQARSGAVSFFSHSDAVIRAIAGVINGEVVYRDLSSEFTNLEKLVEKLMRAPEHAWFVEAALEKSLGGGIIYIVGGKAEAVVSMRESEGAGEFYTAQGEDGLAALYEKIRTGGGVFHVYKSSETLPYGAAAAIANFRLAEPETTASLAAAPKDPSFAARTLSVAAPLEPAREPLPAGGGAGFAAEPIVDTVFVEDAEDAAALRAEPSPAGTSLTNEQYSELINLMGEVVSAVEQSATETTRKQDFSMSLREALIRIAEHYPFLDPFAAEFEYAGGEVVFLGKARPADFVVGLSQALRLTIQDLERRFPDTGIRSRIELALDSLHKRRQLDFERYGLEIALNEILV
jgi:hypothetical protein